ncbi:MAG TPA: CCA tRNA nucleotidyltransferase [Thermoplasmata archaeon]|nr:CCA tRNA nucleotidyltransferase [Thermoplasmata archaeon]
MAGGASAPSAAPGAEAIERRVAERIAPAPELLERVARVRADLVRRVEAAARERGSPLVRALVAGSAARGTFLADRLDLDLFLLFPPELSRDRLREEGLALGRAVLSRPETRYAEHPYLRGEFEGFRVDAVPGFAVSDPSRPLSPVDRTPFHQAYLAERETAELVSQVRLAKEFLRSLGVYGSEAKTEGFSGYLVELLVLRFGSMRRLLEAARLWRLPVDLTDGGPRPPRLPADVALILADPVDPNRNVASALARRNLALVVLAASAYLAAPSEAFFSPQSPPPLRRAEALRRLEARASHASVVRLPRPDLVDDTLYPQVRKAERAIVQEIARSGFEVLGSSSVVGPEHVLVVLEVAHARRSAVRHQEGPPPGLDRVGHFLEKWTRPEAPVVQGPFVRADGSLGVETLRADREVETVIRAILPRLSLGRDLTPSDPSRVEVHPLAGAPDSPALEAALRELLDKRLPWLVPD